jgi:hypothetical protein
LIVKLGRVGRAWPPNPDEACDLLDAGWYLGEERVLVILELKQSGERP